MYSKCLLTVFSEDDSLDAHRASLVAERGMNVFENENIGRGLPLSC